MPTSIITTDDLREFKIDLLEEFEELMSKYLKTDSPKNWLRSSEVRMKLNISHNTLHNLRKKGIIKAYRLEGIVYFDAAEIDRVLLENEVQIEGEYT